MYRFKISFIGLFLFPFLLFAQNSLIPLFQRNLDIPVCISSDSLNNPWAGGINGAAFYLCDVDRDGNEELVVFEKNGNRILVFLRDGDKWQYMPEYRHCFPELHDWMILKDYDGDGEKDIFTYGLAGIRVFHNISFENYPPMPYQFGFELISEQLQSYYYSGYSNIYASPDDYLVVDDVDGDGDLDILNFWVLGKYVHYQRNYAAENNYANGYLDFRLEDECWGKFSEGADNNVIDLMNYCQDKSSSDETRHVGSTMTLLDFNHDRLKDLVLGDIDYAHLIYLRNGGTAGEALMVSQTPDFPNALQPVELYSMPLVSPVDVDGDGIDEFLVSPADPSLVKSQNINSVWLYDYDSLTSDYVLRNTAFLQDEMIDLGSGSSPVLFDWNGDGLLDLFVGNYGYYDSSHFDNGFLTSYYSSSIAYFQNFGSAHSPSFQLITNNFNGLRNYNLQALHPAFGDIDDDGEIEMLCGCSDGTLLLVDENNVTLNYANIDVGEFSTPQLFDIDGDGKLDLLIGNRRGQISYYKNEGSIAAPNFILENDHLGNVDVRDYNLSYYGYATPCFYWNGDEIQLICGNEQGKLFFYDGINGHLNDDFHILADNLFEEGSISYRDIKEGIRTCPAIGFLNDDEFPDMILGNYAGGLAYFDGLEPFPPVKISTEIQQNVKLFPNPAYEFVNIDLSNGDFNSLKIYDICGKLLIEKLITDTHIELNISNLNSGIYIIQIEGKQGNFQQKLIRK